MSINEIENAVHILQQGGLVAFPTETVYGLGADASNPEALRKIFQAKGRPIDHPLIVHLAAIEQLSTWARVISPQVLQLAKAFWPGPLTLILKKAPQVVDLLTGNQDTIGIRIPQHPVAQALLKKFGGGVAAPSANRFGRISPTTATAVREELGDRVDCILDGGHCAVGVESTIVDMTGQQPVILRPGRITVQQITAVLGVLVATQAKQAPRVSGSFESHYAPVTPTRLVASENITICLQQAIAPIGVVRLIKTLTPPPLPQKSTVGEGKDNVVTVGLSDNPEQYAHDLYQTLRELDKKNLRQILIEKVPAGVEWDAVRDRLNKASGSSVN